MAFGLLKNLSAKKRAQTDPDIRDRFLDVDGERLPVRVVEHPKSKRITLRLLPGGEGLKVTLPAYVGDHELDDFLARNRNWVAARRARLPQSVRLGEGASVSYLGVEHRIVLTGRLRGLVERSDQDGEPVLIVPGDPKFIERRLHDFLKKEARHHLSQAVDRYAGVLGVRPKQIRITDTTSRWGSCSSTKTLSFSWRIIMAPPEVLDYLAAHEVAHLREMNHSDRFWDLVRQICPEMDTHKSWLRRHGSTLHAISLAS
jgi:predicted metal-dependent hydrolase